MFSLLLKTALPFTLTFVVGAALGGLTRLFGGAAHRAAPAYVTRTYDFKRGCGGGARRHRLVAESRPLVILFKPDARLPSGGALAGGEPGSARVNVTFGADGEVKEVRPLASWFHGRDESLVRVKAMWEAAEGAARRIRFTPETVDGLPVAVEREVEIRFLPN